MAKSFVLKGLIQFYGEQEAKKKMKSIDSAVSGLKDKMSRISEGGKQVGVGLQGVGIAGTAVGAGFGFMIKQAADFEQGMANVNAITSFTKEEFNSLQKEALRLGATTVFTASQAAEGMKILTKTGLNAHQTIQAMPSVLAAAAAEEMDLAHAAEIVVGITHSMNKDMDESAHITDVLAKTAANSASSIASLGEGFKFASKLTAEGVMSFEEASASLGVLETAGLQGGMAGRSLAAMFSQIAKPSKEVAAVFGGQAKMMKLFTDETGKLKPLPELINLITAGADAQGNQLQRLAFLSDFVGEVGAKAFSRLQTVVFKKDAKGRPMWQGLVDDLHHAGGAAQEMATKRLDSLEGAFRILNSAIEMVSIGMGKAFLPVFREEIVKITDTMTKFGQTLIAIGTPIDELNDSEKALLKTPMAEFARGLMEGFKQAIDTVKTFVGWMKSGFELIYGPMANSNKELGTMIGKWSALLAVIGPVALAMAGAFFVFGQMATGIMGLTRIIGVFMGPAGTMLKWGFTAIRFMTILSFRTWPMMISAIRMGITALTAAFSINPIVLGIMAAIAAIALLVIYWDDVTKFMQHTWENLATWFHNASLGEIILKSILFPMRVALTPIVELIRFIMGSSIAKKVLGDKATIVKELADRMSLFSDTASGGGPIGGAKEIAGPTVSQPTERVNQGKIEQTRLALPEATDQAVNVSVQQAPIEANFAIDVNLDGQKMDRQQMKRTINRSERAGQNISPKSRQMMKNGQFVTAPGM